PSDVVGRVGKLRQLMLAKDLNDAQHVSWRGGEHCSGRVAHHRQIRDRPFDGEAHRNRSCCLYQQRHLGTGTQNFVDDRAVITLRSGADGRNAQGEAQALDYCGLSGSAAADETCQRVTELEPGTVQETALPRDCSHHWVRRLLRITMTHSSLGCPYSHLQ